MLPGGGVGCGEAINLHTWSNTQSERTAFMDPLHRGGCDLRSVCMPSRPVKLTWVLGPGAGHCDRGAVPQAGRGEAVLHPQLSSSPRGCTTRGAPIRRRG